MNSTDSSTDDKPIKKVIKMRDDSKITYIKNFIDQKTSQKLFKELKSKVPWTHGVYNMFGRDVKTQRLLYAMKNKDADISESYSVTESMTWTRSIKKIKTEVEKQTGKSISYAQLNYYRDGNDYIGFHTDSEVQTGDIVASISLGAHRNFVFRNIKDMDKRHKMVLENSSLLIMDENSAKNCWKHSLPKMKNAKERINITFRPR